MVGDHTSLLEATKLRTKYAEHSVKQLRRVYDWNIKWQRLIDESSLGILALQPNLATLRDLTNSQRLISFWQLIDLASQTSADCKAALRFSAKLSYIRPKAAQALLSCEEPSCLVKTFVEPHLLSVHCQTHEAKSIEESLAVYAQCYLQQLTDAKLEQIKDQLSKMKNKAIASYAN